MEPFYRAIVSNNLRAVKNLLENCHEDEINNICREGKTVLNVAVRENSVSVVRLLVQAGARLDNQKASLCPLFIAVRNECLPMVKVLLELGADVQRGWVLNETIPTLQFAINYLNLDIIKLLLEKGASANSRHMNTHETPLHIAAYYFGTKFAGEELRKVQVKVSKILIQNGANVNAKNYIGRTPLDSAICSENSELCKLLLREGAEVFGTGRIWEDGIPQNRFEYIACVRALRCPDLIRLCLERGGDYNYRDRHGLTPYHCGLAKHNPKMVKVYWEFGCPYDQPEEQPGKMREMLWYHPDKEDKNIMAVQTDFMDGIKLNRLDVVKRALEKGAVPKGCSMKIPSTLHYVASKGSCGIATILLSKGVPVNRINSRGETPLIVAAQRKNLELCKVFLQFGACFTQVDGHSVGAVVEECKQLNELFKEVEKAFRLVKKGKVKLLKVLRRYVTEDFDMLLALMNCVNRRGLTLMGQALSLQHLEIAKELMKFRVKYLQHQ